MGLDMYASTTQTKPACPVDFAPVDPIEFYCWRGRPNLHGWMEALYRQKGGTNPEFNCVAVTLDIADLDRLEADLTMQRLPETGGFLVGALDSAEISKDLEFVYVARRFVAEGLTVFYTSWW